MPLQDANPTPSFGGFGLRLVVPNGSRANMMLILQRGFSDRITVSYSAMGISEDFFVEGHKLTVDEGWTAVTRELLLEGV